MQESAAGGWRELEGQVALVTGAARGIGLAIARELAAGGARVAVVDLEEEASRVAAASLPGRGHEGFRCDVRDPGGAAETVAAVEEALGGISILVNNAGVTRDGLLIRLSDEDWDLVLEVNLRGTFNFTRAAARGMMKRRAGAIVNIASVIGLMGNAGQTNYAASKAGIIGLTKSVARELAARGVRCNAIAPGFIRTEMTARLKPETVEMMQAQIPMGRLGDPEDVARVARFLAGPWAEYITGQVVTVDGGMVM